MYIYICKYNCPPYFYASQARRTPFPPGPNDSGSPKTCKGPSGPGPHCGGGRRPAGHNGRGDPFLPAPQRLGKNQTKLRAAPYRQ